MAIWLWIILAVLTSYWFGYFVLRGAQEACAIAKYLDTFKDKLLIWLITVTFDPWWYLKDHFRQSKSTKENLSYPKPVSKTILEDPRNNWIM